MQDRTPNTFCTVHAALEEPMDKQVRKGFIQEVQSFAQICYCSMNVKKKSHTERSKGYGRMIWRQSLLITEYLHACMMETVFRMGLLARYKLDGMAVRPVIVSYRRIKRTWPAKKMKFHGHELESAGNRVSTCRSAALMMVTGRGWG